jgi:hypothetical protein
VILCSDGLLARGGFGVAGVARAVAAAAAPSAAGIARAVQHAAVDAAEGPLADDVAVLVLAAG